MDEEKNLMSSDTSFSFKLKRHNCCLAVTIQIQCTTGCGPEPKRGVPLGYRAYPIQPVEEDAAAATFQTRSRCAKNWMTSRVAQSHPAAASLCRSSRNTRIIKTFYSIHIGNPRKSQTANTVRAATRLIKS